MIRFVHLPPEVPPRFVNYPSFAPIGPLAAASWLCAQGHEVSVWEALAEGEPGTALTRTRDSLLLGGLPTPERSIGALDAPALVILAFDMFCHPDRHWGRWARQISKAIKRRQPRALVYVADCHIGGVDYVPVEPRALLGGLPDVDGYVRGEPELALGALAAGRAPETIPGVFTRGRAGDAGWAEPLGDLDRAPLPAWSLLSLDRFFAVQRELVRQDLIHEFHGEGNLLPAMTSRGCPYHCTFCAGLPQRTHRALSPETFRAHAEAMKALGADTLFLLDDVMNLSTDRFKAILRVLTEADVSWTPVNGLRADRLDREAVALFARSGGFTLKVSAESGDERVLREVVRKRMTPAPVREVARWARDEGVPLLIHYVFGFVGERLEEANRTLLLASELLEQQGAAPRMQIATPVPGTALHAEAVAGGHLSVFPDRFALLSSFVQNPWLDTPELPAPLQTALLELFQQRVAQATDPVLLLDPSYRCNQRCTFCSTALMHRDTFPETILTGAIRWAAERGFRRLDFGGGEPTLHPGLPRLVRLARRAGIPDVGLVTNGRLLSYPDYLDRIRRAGVTRIVLSVAAHTEALHDEITATPGAYLQTLTALDHLAGRGELPVTLNLVVCRSTAPVLPAIVRFYLSRWRFAGLNLQVVLPMGNAVVRNEVLEDLTALEPVLSEALEAAGAVPTSAHNLPPCFLPRRVEALLKDACKGGRYLLDAQGAPQPFSEVIGRVLTHLPYCERCPAYVLCSGVPRRQRDRFAADAWRPDRVTEALLARRSQGGEAPKDPEREAS